MIGYIYKIINKVNNHFYVGSTVNPKARKYRHFSELKHGKHHSIFLQRAYDLYGAENFIFKICKKIKIDNIKELDDIEERYLQLCWNSGKLYNVSNKASGGDLISNHPNRELIIEKHRKNSKRHWESLSDEEKEQWCERSRGKNNGNYGHKWSNEQREKASKREKEYYKTHTSYRLGKTVEEMFGEERGRECRHKLSEIAKQRTGNKNPFYGKHHSELKLD